MFPLNAQELQLISKSEFTCEIENASDVCQLSGNERKCDSVKEQTSVIADCLEIKFFKF